MIQTHLTQRAVSCRAGSHHFATLSLDAFELMLVSADVLSGVLVLECGGEKHSFSHSTRAGKNVSSCTVKDTVKDFCCFSAVKSKDFEN